MAQILKFFDAEHEYVVGDKKIPAVSEILRFLSREMYSSISQYSAMRQNLAVENFRR